MPLEKPTTVIPSLTIGHKSPPILTTLTLRDSLLYALGINYSNDPMNTKDLRYTFEMDDDFKVFPTVAFIHKKFSAFDIIESCPGIPKFNPMMLLHGEQKTEFLKNFEIDQNYISISEIVDVVDKVKGCVVVFTLKTYEENQEKKFSEKDLCSVTTTSIFIRGLGGFGFKGKNTLQKLPEIPLNLKPNFCIVEKTNPNLAVIYRLCGDRNPLHISPNMGRIAGFKRPILHGLSTYGICAKVLVDALADGDGDKLRMIRARFTSYVFPGESLVVSGWIQGNSVLFRAVVKERESVVIVGVALVGDMDGKL